MLSCKRHQEGCPYCSDKQMLKGYNTLQETHPYLEKFGIKVMINLFLNTGINHLMF